MNCTGKSAFPSMVLAAKVARKAMRRHQGVRREAYHCVDCGQYHVGSVMQPRAARRRPRAEATA